MKEPREKRAGGKKKPKTQRGVSSYQGGGSRPGPHWWFSKEREERRDELKYGMGKKGRQQPREEERGIESRGGREKNSMHKEGEEGEKLLHKSCHKKEGPEGAMRVPPHRGRRWMGEKGGGGRTLFFIKGGREEGQGWNYSPPEPSRLEEEGERPAREKTSGECQVFGGRK